MNREQAKELLPIIQAFAEGKTILVQEDIDWCYLGDETDFDLSPQRYRIKPEPKYRPFTNADECWQEMQKHEPFGWIKGPGEYKNISSIRTTGSYPILINVEIRGEQYEVSRDMSKMFKDYTFADGSIFGIKE